MITKKKALFFFYLCLMGLLVAGGSLFITGRLTVEKIASITSSVNPSVLGQTVNSPTILPTLTQKAPLPTAIPFSVYVQSAPTQLNEAEPATFTWYVNGSSQVIKSTTVYYGETSDPQVFNTNLSPEDSPYTHSLVDFMQGRYVIPLQFIAFAKDVRPGIFYYRAYAKIGGKNYWSNEGTFAVKESPKHEIKIIDPLTSAHKGENITFTWDISGPPAVTGYTAIVAAKESKPGALDKSVDTTQTPYKNIVTEYTSGSHTVPLRFIGNTTIQEEGTYYYRAVTTIDNKNTWSDEYTLKVE